MSKEIWKPINNAINYEVSNLGNVRNGLTKQILKNHKTKTGYLCTTIKLNDNKYHYCLVHRLVANAFIPNPNNKPCTNHKDFNRSNNKVDNLEWVSYSENNKYSAKHIGLAHKGKKRTLAQRIKMSKAVVKKQEHHIYKNGKGWLFSITMYGSRHEEWFKNKEEAIKNRDRYLEKLGYE